MCVNCLVSARPDRGTVCLDDGVYILNFKGCAVCGARGLAPREVNRRETTTVESADDDDDDDESAEPEETEEVEFQHVCAECGHVVASHYYREVCSSRSQRYLMECPLCGKGADERPLHHLRPHPVIQAVPGGGGGGGGRGRGGDEYGEVAGLNEGGLPGDEGVQAADGRPAESHSNAFAAAAAMIDRTAAMAAMRAAASSHSAGAEDDDDEEDEWGDNDDDGDSR